ncbi:cold-shock protein [Chondromyces crocatus]|uniref:CSD domain-containing protein n=1 Tax=Chondromyces crocatus TaxID=52 RepID=A0A0K1EHE5_CHOCO|nr:cold shock domain-containing protein [Chondromyces crocatus]AKT40285.1 uncharacterized protein CMC5_044380 [Chondromyces crocatus]
MATGTVFYFSKDKGMGVIKQDGDDAQVRVLAADIEEPETKHLITGQKVEFEVSAGAEALRALNVRVV